MEKIHEKLFNSCESGNWRDVKKILEENINIDVNWANPKRSKRTALYMCSRNGHVECVKQLLKHPDIDVNLRERSGYFPLLAAGHYDNITCVKELLKRNDLDVTQRINPQKKTYGTAFSWTRSNRVLREFCKSKNLKMTDSLKGILETQGIRDYETVEKIYPYPDRKKGKDIDMPERLDFVFNSVERYVVGENMEATIFLRIGILKTWGKESSKILRCVL